MLKQFRCQNSYGAESVICCPLCLYEKYLKMIIEIWSLRIIEVIEISEDVFDFSKPVPLHPIYIEGAWRDDEQ